MTSLHSPTRKVTSNARWNAPLIVATRPADCTSTGPRMENFNIYSPRRK